MPKQLLILVAIVFLHFQGKSQDADSLIKELIPEKVKASGSTFKSTHVVLLHSSETEKKHDLDFMIKHHFGDIGGDFGGVHTLYGLDAATDLFIGFDYGFTNRLTAGIGRSKQDELYNLYLKYKLIEQAEGKMPVTLTLLGQGGWITRKAFSNAEFSNSSDRISYFLQGIIARRFSSRVSFEVLPSYLIRTQAPDALDKNNLFSLGFAGRFKMAKRVALVADYQLVNAFGRSNNLSDTYYNPLGLGLEIETGGHVFSLNFMNSEGIIENNFIPNTKKSWRHGGVRFAFTISRNFTLFKSKNPDIETKIY